MTRRSVDQHPEPRQDALIKAADAALYQSKNGGKNCVSVWPFPAKVTADIASDARASAPGQATPGVAAPFLDVCASIEYLDTTTAAHLSKT
jgi:hypothetical protein